MSESWNGITLAEIRHAAIKNLKNNFMTVARLIDPEAGTNYEFETWKSGAIIVSNNYMNWKFIAPNDFELDPGTTVDSFFENMKDAVTKSPVAAWDDFAVFLNGRKSTINLFLTNGAEATITDASGNTYPGTVHKIESFSNFADCVSWLKSWMGEEILAEDSGVIYANDNVIQFSLTASGTTISCNFKL